MPASGVSPSRSIVVTCLQDGTTRTYMYIYSDVHVHSYCLLLVHAMIAVLLLTLQVVLSLNVKFSVELCCDRGASSTQSRVIDTPCKTYLGLTSLASRNLTHDFLPGRSWNIGRGGGVAAQSSRPHVCIEYCSSINSSVCVCVSFCDAVRNAYDD